MDASQALWKKFREAQDAKNADAAAAYKKAIEHANKGKAEDSAWWERQGDMAMMPTTIPTVTTEEYATR